MSLSITEEIRTRRSERSTFAAPASRAAEWLTDWRNGLFITLMLANLLPLWSFKYFPSQDGPSHLYNAILLRDYNRPDRAIFREYFTPNTRPVPNWLSGLSLSALSRVVPPLTAEKILMSAYLLLLPLAMRYCLGAIRRRASVLATAMLPFVPNFFYHMGFINFCFSFAMFFIVLGYWLKHRRRFGTRQMIVLAMLSIVAYFTHLVGAMMAWMFIVVLSLAMQPRAMTLVRRCACQWRVWVAAVPTLALMAFFFLGPKLGPDLDPACRAWWKRLRYPITWMKSFDPLELIACVAMIGVIAGTAWYLWRRRSARAISGLGWLTMIILGVIVFLVMPDNIAGGTYLVVRLAPFPLLAMLFWIASQPIAQRRFDRVSSILCGIGAASAVLLLGVHFWKYAQLSPYMYEMEAIAADIAPNSTLLPIDLSDGATLLAHSRGKQPVLGVDPFYHITEHNLAERGVVNLRNAWAVTGYHPLRYRAEMNPFSEQRPPTDLNMMPVLRKKPVDYVLVWTGGNEQPGPTRDRVRRQLAANYELIAKSPYSGYAELYRRKR